MPVENGLTSDMLLLPKYQYLAIGLRTGYLTLCKYLSNVSVLFTVKAHLRPVLALFQHPVCPNMILSGATDGYIRIWNVEARLRT
ncbi:MAG: WD40 repeat domain-containing protein [Candidatus Pacebacteria bacterium]|nr:WD40 repeat domain-containing protein [Candidatus Paceibacterota bacterium]